jgi:ABC-type multidrug transport system ATPase subunit
MARFSVKYRPSFSFSLPFGLTIGLELPPGDPPREEEAPFTDARLLRVRRLAADATSALELDNLARAVSRLLALADEFPVSERRDAVLLSHRVSSLQKARHTLAEDRWEAKKSQLAAEVVDAVGTYQGMAELAWQARRRALHPSLPRGEGSSVPEVHMSTAPSAGRRAVECEGLGWRVDDRWILQDVSFELLSGSVAGVVGPNGAGKTTLLRLLAQELVPSSGRVGYPALTLPGYPARRVRDRIAYVPQIPTPYHGELEANLKRFAALRGLRDAALVDEVSFVMERFQLSSYRTSGWSALSGGFRTRFELARAVLAAPDVIVLDEPLGPLDRKAEREYLRHLRDLAESRRDACIVLTSQDVHAVAAIADSVIVLRNGKVRFAGPPADLEETLSRRTYEFAGELTMRELVEVFAVLPEVQLHDLGSTRRLVTGKSVLARDVIGLLQAGGESIRYFRDLSASPQAILEEGDVEGAP